MRSPLLACMQKHDVRGSILLASEGVNGTIAGSDTGVAAVLEKMRSYTPLADLKHKTSYADDTPFARSKVRLKKEIVSLGQPDANPLDTVGQYIAPEDWNAVISDPHTLVIDTRNSYEYSVGTFKHAKDPKTGTFREFPQYVEKELDPNKHTQVAMFCTGGIRCEKATAYMLNKGFKKVMHLEGGILKYLETIPPEESLWEGECFVFDERVTVDHHLKPGSFSMCYACGMPVSPQDKQSEHYVEGQSCPHCFDKYDDESRARFAERQRQMQLAKECSACAEGGD